MCEQQRAHDLSSPIDFTSDFTAAEHSLFGPIDFRLRVLRLNVSRALVRDVARNGAACGAKSQIKTLAKSIGKKWFLPELAAVRTS